MKKNKLNLNFGNKIRFLRENNGYNQYDFATDCDISEAYYGRIERGEHTPSLEIIFKIAKALGISISDLLKDVEKF